VKKVAFEAIQSPLHKELASGDKTDSLSHTSASNTIVFLSGSNESYISAKIPSPFCLWVALENHLIIRVFQLSTFCVKLRFFPQIKSGGKMTFHFPPISFRRVTEEKSNGRIVTLNEVKGLLGS